MMALGKGLLVLAERSQQLALLDEAEAAFVGARQVYVEEAKQAHHADYFAARLAEVEAAKARALARPSD